jgi:hypothetical protein
MFWHIMTAFSWLQGLLFLGTAVGTIASMFRDKPITKEQEERAAMHSFSWPTDSV